MGLTVTHRTRLCVCSVDRHWRLKEDDNDTFTESDTGTDNSNYVFFVNEEDVTGLGDQDEQSTPYLTVCRSVDGKGQYPVRSWSALLVQRFQGLTPGRQTRAAVELRRSNFLEWYWRHLKVSDFRRSILCLVMWLSCYKLLLLPRFFFLIVVIVSFTILVGWVCFVCILIGKFSAP